MMLDWLGEKDAAKRLENAVLDVLKEGRIRTPDLGGTHKTRDMTEAIILNL
jgi:isocitrate/isopropylmalate dehydrogenase